MANKKTPEKTAAPSSDQPAKGDEMKKTRLVLEEPIDSPLNHFQNTLKDRGVKNLDLNGLVCEALAQVPEEWWETKIEELTPLKFKLDAALEDPKMREKLISLLDTNKSSLESSASF